MGDGSPAAWGDLVMEYKTAGTSSGAAELPGAFRLGTEDSQQLFTQAEMIEKFALERCSKSRRHLIPPSSFG